MWVQLFYLFILAMVVACIAWTITQEEVFREAREYCVQKSKSCRSIFQRKFFYLFTCEYCFSHYVSALLILITGFSLLYNDWRGYIISFFALVWVANLFMTFFALLRQGLKKEKMEANIKKVELEELQQEVE